MRRAAVWAVVAGAGLVGLTSCTSTRPPERYPELSDTTPAEQLCTVREDDHCFIASVDFHFIVQYDVNVLTPGVYRQHLIPAGKHLLSIYYREQQNLDTTSAGPRIITLDAKPGATYVLKSNRTFMGYDVGNELRTANWRPEVVDAATGQTVAKAGVND